MNFLTTREHDKFSGKTTTKTIPFDWGGISFNFQHVSNQEGEILYIEIHNRYCDCLYLKSGELIFNINNTKNIKLKSISGLYFQDFDLGKLEETAFYKITKEQLLSICKAKSIEYCLTGDHTTKQCTDYDEDGDSNVTMDGEVILNDQEYLADDYSKIQYGAQALYNAIYDETAFNRELQKIKRDILKEDEMQNARKKAEETKKHEKIKKNRVASFFMVLFGIILLLGGLVLVGWGLEAGEPVGLLGLLAGFIGLVLLICSCFLKTK